MLKDLVKQQASRLAAYLSDKHRVNLKHSAALNAMAVAHGARDWQTLQAQSEPAVPFATIPGPAGRMHPLTWTLSGAYDTCVDEYEWLRHASACGTRTLTRDWLQATADHCLTCKDISGLFFDDGSNWPRPGATTAEVLAATVVLDLRSGKGASAQAPESLLPQMRASATVVRVLLPNDPWEAQDVVSEWLRVVSTLRSGPGLPLVMGLPVKHALGLPDLQRLAGQGRSSNVVLRLAVDQTSPDGRFSTPLDKVLDNMAHRVYLQPTHEGVLAAFKETVASATSVCFTRGSVQIGNSATELSAQFRCLRTLPA